MAQRTPSWPPGGMHHSPGPALLACLQCRQKHLKCDAKVPVCGRCDKAKVECHYMPSRRGYKDSSKRPRIDPENSGAVTPNLCQGNGFSLNRENRESQWTVSTHSNTSTESDVVRENPGPDQILHDWDALVSLDQGPVASIETDEHLIDIYYTFFHPSHPILPPLRCLTQSSPLPPYLKVVLKFIGSHFSADIDSDAYRFAAVAALRDAPDTGQKVQALLLFSVALHARHERGEAIELVTAATTVARELSMNRSSYAETFGGENPIQEESLRRTWWELYVADSLFSAFDGKDPSVVDIVDDDMPLPSDELEYTDGRCMPLPPTVAQFHERAYTDDERQFSSFCQRIEAVRILRRVLSLGRTDWECYRDQVDFIDASISSWFYLLPDSQTEVIRVDGTIDEMLFQAYMAIHCAAIYLHFPRSNLLPPSVAAAEVLCAERGNVTLPASAHHSHALKAIKAADGISALASLRLPGHNHTPFFICALSVSAIVQLSICSVSTTRRLEPRLDKVTLTIGFLKSLNRTWAVSQQVLRQIRAVARGILENGNQPQSNPLPENNGIDLDTIIANDLWLGDIHFPI